MDWASFSVDAGLGEHAQAWDELNRDRFSSHPMLSAAFVGGLLRHFPQPGVRLFVLHDGHGPQAMCLMHRTAGGRWSSFLPSQAQIGPALLRPPLDLSRLTRQLPGLALQTDLLCIDPAVHGAELAAGRHVQSHLHALTMAIDLRGGFDAYWSTRSKKLRENIRRYERRVDDEGLAVRFEVAAAAPQVAAGVQRYAELESAGWKARAGTALAPGNDQHAFYRDLLVGAAADDRARVFELWFGDRLVASRLVLAGPAMVVALKTTFDESFKRHAPGRILLRRTLEQAFATWPGRSLEFYTNASADQLAWATSRRAIVHLSAQRGAAVAWAVQQRNRVRARRDDDDATVEVLPLAGEVPADVATLFDVAEGQRVGFGLDWLRHLDAAVFGADGASHVYVLRRAGQPVAALPVRVDPRTPRLAEAVGNFYTTLYAPAITPGAEPTVLAPLLRALRVAHPGLASLRFAPMDPLDPAFTALRTSLAAAGLPAFAYFCHGNWYEPVAQDSESYLRQREGKLRSTIKRHKRKLSAAGARIEIVSSGDALERAVAAFADVYARSWKRPEPFPGFMPGLIRLCCRRGWMRMGLVWSGEQAIAAQLWIVANGRAEIYKLAYDEAHKALAPGTVLTALMMRRAIDVDRVSEIDYLIGDDPYKSQWMSKRRERWGLVAYNRRSLRGLFGWLRETAITWLRPLGSAWRAWPSAAR